MSKYESELKDPVRNLLLGQLARSLLIQVQRLKLDTEAAMLELDQILRANVGHEVHAWLGKHDCCYFHNAMFRKLRNAPR